jgi:polar amino acid transport system substrate-binding protein
MRPRVIALAAAVAVAVMAMAAGCGSSNNNTSSTASLTATPGITQQPDSKIVAELPSAVKSKGELSVAEDAGYPPDEFIASDGHTVIGMDADMAKAIAQLMGLTPKIQNVTFNNIIPGLAANRYDLGMSSFTDTIPREKQVDFVDYLTAGTSVYAKKDGGPDVTSLDQLCGLKVGAEKGTTQQEQISKQDAKCKSEGKPGVTPEIFEKQPDVDLAVSSGRADVAMADTPVAAYIVEKSNGEFKLTSGPIPPEPYGIAIPKNTGMTQPVFDAIKTLMDNGTYKKILEYWGLQEGAIDAPTINQGVPG